MSEYRYWESKEDAILRAGYAEFGAKGCRLLLLADGYDRTERSCTHRAQKLELQSSISRRNRVGTRNSMKLGHKGGRKGSIGAIVQVIVPMADWEGKVKAPRVRSVFELAELEAA